MISTVVFDSQALTAIQQVWPANETALDVTDGNLSLGPGKSGEHQEHPQPSLHCGLGLRLGQVNNTPKPSDALGSRMPGDMSAQLGDGDKRSVKEQVGGYNAFDQ